MYPVPLGSRGKNPLQNLASGGGGRIEGKQGGIALRRTASIPADSRPADEGAGMRTFLSELLSPLLIIGFLRCADGPARSVTGDRCRSPGHVWCLGQARDAIG